MTCARSLTASGVFDSGASMPRHRLLADGKRCWASAATGSGDPLWRVRAGDVVPVVLDATGWVGLDALDQVEWCASPGVTLSGQTMSGAEAKCHAWVPAPGEYPVSARLLASNGQVQHVTVHLRAA